MAKIRILGATLKSFTWHPQADDDKPTVSVIQITANMTKKLADQFGKQWLFDDKGVARSFENKVGIGLTVDGGTVSFGQDRLFEIVRAWKFSAFHANEKDNDLTLKITCRIQIVDSHIEALAWAIEQGAKSFGVVIAPKQMSFGDDDETKETDEPAEESKPGPTLAPQATMRKQRQSNLSEVTQ